MFKMKRPVLSYLLVLFFLGSTMIAFTQSGPESAGRPKVCPFEISGIWRSDATTLSTPVFFDFSSEGHVTLLSYTADALAKEFEVLTSVNYKLDKPKAPTQIEFTAVRGNEFFVRGVTALKIIEYNDDSFTTLDLTSEQPTRWSREQTHRYFLTFAARSETPLQGGSAFAMWTILGGREPNVEALGVQLSMDNKGGAVPVFGPIPADVYDQVTEAIQKDKKTKAEIVTARFELTPAEFATTYETYQQWDKDTKARTLAEKDPYLNALEFLRQSAEGLNQCGEKAGLQRPTRRDRDELVSKQTPQRRPLEYTRILRKKNEELNVTDSIYPWFWRPTLRMPEQ